MCFRGSVVEYYLGKVGVASSILAGSFLFKMGKLEDLLKKREDIRNLDNQYTQEINEHLEPLILEVMQKMKKHGNYICGAKPEEIKFCFTMAYDVEIENSVLMDALDYLKFRNKVEKRFFRNGDESYYTYELK